VKRIPRDPARWEALQWLADICHLEGRAINDPAALSALVGVVKSRVAEVLGDPERMPGIAHETMFENVVIELGIAEFIKREDSGEITAASPVQPPDYRIALPGGRCLLVEVKTAKSDRHSGIRIPEKEFGRLAEYARLAGGELWFATFWEGLDVWTLTMADDFHEEGTYLKLDMTEAMKRNAMTDLGDVWVFTVPPIGLRLVPDATRPRQLDASGAGAYTIASVELACDGRVIQDKVGKNLAFFIFLFGGWNHVGPTPQLAEDGRTIVHMDWRAEPDDFMESNGKRGVGQLSSMYARMFRAFTMDDDGKYVRLRLNPSHGRLRRLVSPNFPFQQSGLRLWVFDQQPNR